LQRMPEKISGTCAAHFPDKASTLSYPFIFQGASFRTRNREF
jgi:hypothetical protein